MTDRILAVTEIYNEARNIPRLVENIASQSYRPETWLLINDGSTDDSSEIFAEACRVHEIPFLLERMPTKTQPDANKKGIAFQQSVLSETKWLNMQNFDYIIKLDADTVLPPGYIRRALEIMRGDPTIGCFAGQIEGEIPRKMPCGTGKIVRWEILKLTNGRYWDLDPDTLWNIIAYSNEYQIVLGDDSFLMQTTGPTKLFNPQGRYWMGQRMAYVKCNTLIVGYRYLKSLKERTHSWQFLKGYLREWLRLRNRWRCNDNDVQWFYSLKRQYSWYLKKLRKKISRS